MAGIDIRNPTAVPRGELTAWLTFAACLISVFMQMIDVTIVNTALPDITRDLRASRSAQLLVISGYSVAFACVLLTAARLGALWGRRRLFLVAVVVFTASSVWCGISTGAEELVIARIVQGIAGGAMAAQTLAILAASFPRGRHPQVFALYGLAAGGAGMVGPILGGVLLTLDLWGLGWHWVFLINLPLGIVAFVLAARFLHVGAESGSARLDLGGVLLSAASLLALLYGLAEVQEHGWGTLPVGTVLAALALGAGFLAYQRVLIRRGRPPLMRPDLFGNRGFAIGAVLVTGFFGMFTAFVFAASITLQDELHFSPLRTGIAMTVFALGAGAGALAAPLLVRRWGVRSLACGIALYAGCMAVAAVYLALTGGRISVALTVVPVFVSGLGVGVFGLQVQPVMLAGLDQGQVGETSGLLPTLEQIGNAVGLAVLSTVFFRAHTLGGSIAMFTAIAVVAAGIAGMTLLLPEPARHDAAGLTGSAPR
ncbi:MFS transporter [Nocardia alni]|uniref:MFS transporter n=1 Tax=Nocardia alni TaxID=2815723 RepID=UPI0027E03576|nr:MFS transporter [Nocardia alni]